LRHPAAGLANQSSHPVVEVRFRSSGDLITTTSDLAAVS
jgi:hypothetical protein